MPDFGIRAARADEHDGVARLWMESWVSTGLDTASERLLEKLRERILREIENGWSLFVAEDGSRLAAMLAINLGEKYLDQLLVAPEYQGRSLGRRLLAFTRTQLPGEISLRCALKNEKAWRQWSDSNIRIPSQRPFLRMLESKGPLANICFQWSLGFDIRFARLRLGG